ncbi:MAG: M1 family peptidase, partial [Flavobacteriales bacterium]
MKYFYGIALFLFQAMVFGQHQDKVDFTHAIINVGIDPYEQSIEGTVRYDFLILKNVDSVYLDAKNMVFESVRLKNKKVAFENNGKTLTIRYPFKSGKSYSISINYQAYPKQTVYFVNWEHKMPSMDASTVKIIGKSLLGPEQVWTQGQGKYTSHWLPSFDDMNEKVEFDLSIRFDPKYEVIANGKYLGSSIGSDGTKEWKFDML